MADMHFAPLSLNCEMPLAPFEFAGGALSIATDAQILAINYSSGTKAKLAKKIGNLPQTSKSAAFKDSTLLWSEAGQLFCYSDGKTITETELSALIGDAGYVTDLTDGWDTFHLHGPQVVQLMDQLVLPDLCDHVFRPGDVISTVFLHIRVLIWHRGQHGLTVLSPASYSEYFWRSLRSEIELSSRIQEQFHV